MVYCPYCKQNTRWLTHCASHMDHERQCRKSLRAIEEENRGIYQTLERRVTELQKTTMAAGRSVQDKLDKVAVEVERTRKLTEFSIQLQLSYCITPGVRLVLEELHRLPDGYLTTLEQGNQVIDRVYQLFGGNLDLSPGHPEYKNSKTFLKDVARLLYSKAAEEELRVSLIEYTQGLDEDIAAA